MEPAEVGGALRPRGNRPAPGGEARRGTWRPEARSRPAERRLSLTGVLEGERKRRVAVSRRSNPLVIVENGRDAADYLRSGLGKKAFRFVTFDWPTLEALRKRGEAAFALEDFIPRDVGLKYQEMVEERARDWFLLGGEDPTEFHGISLGAAFTLELLQYFAYAFRYAIAMTRAVHELEPSHLVAYLMPEDHPYLEHAIKRDVIARIARDHGLRLQRYGSIGPEQVKRLPEMIGRDIYGLDPAKRGFFRLVSGLGRAIGRFRRRRPEVLIVPEGIFYNPLLERYLETIGDLGFRITFPVMSHPPRSLALRMIARGTIPFFPAGRAARKGLGGEIATVRRRIAELMRRPRWRHKWVLEGVDFSPVFRKILDEVVMPDIEVTARFALGCADEMERRPIRALVVPNDKARPTRVMLEVAKVKGIETFYFEHGLTTFRPPETTLGRRRLVDTVICWGEQERCAYVSRGVDPERIIELTPPFLADYLPMQPAHLRRSGRVLVLQHCYTKDHVNGVAHCEEEYLIRLCEGLRESGFVDLRLKIHPGMSMKGYFENLVRERGLDIEVFKDESLRELILWSDLVIGPISTAILEVLLLGREYYCVDLEGIGYEGVSVFDGDRIRVFSSVEEVLAAVRNRDESPCERTVIRSICGIDPSTTREDVLDPFLDYFEERCRAGFRSWRPAGGTVG